MPDGRIHLTQPPLIDQITIEVGINTRLVGGPTLVSCTKLLKRSEGEQKFDGNFHYRRIVGKLKVLEKSSRPDIAYTTRQYARFFFNPSKEYDQVIIYLAVDIY